MRCKGRSLRTHLATVASKRLQTFSAKFAIEKGAVPGKRLFWTFAARCMHYAKLRLTGVHSSVGQSSGPQIRRSLVRIRVCPFCVAKGVLLANTLQLSQADTCKRSAQILPSNPERLPRASVSCVFGVARVPLCVCNACSPHWGLNPGPSVYKTDALPLSYRGLMDARRC